MVVYTSMAPAGLSTRALHERRWKGRDAHQHVAGPQEVKALVLKRKRFDVSLHKGYPIAHALLHRSGPSLLDVELGQVQAHDSASKALGQPTAVIASSATDIEDERGSADSTGGGDLVKHGVRAWVQALIERREGTSLVAGPHMGIDRLHLRFFLRHERIFPSSCVRGSPRVPVMNGSAARGH